jgi:predicted GNAT family acetyltransferase
VPGHLRSARNDEVDLMADWIFNFSVDAHVPADAAEARASAEWRIGSGDMFVWEVDAQPVSLAVKSRPSSHGITVGLVYTPCALRNRGYASACVAALSQQLLDAGWEFCSLYTDLANPTSNSIYQRIGYRPVCDSNEYDFNAR